MLYGTTKRFLEVFGLSGLDDLPKLDGQFTLPPAAAVAQTDEAAADTSEPTEAQSDN
jgi:hypothetical protein